MKIAAYARVSSEEQRDNQTIEGQIAYIRQHCLQQGWEVAAEFLDDGVSGDTPFDLRPAGARLLSAAQAGHFDAVVVFLYDRFSRDVLVGLLAAKTLRESGVVPLSCCEPFELGTPHGDYSFVQSLNNSQLWKAQFLQRIRAGIDRWSREGVWMGGIVPFGYTVEGAKKEARLVVDTSPLPGCSLSAAQVVQLLYKAIGQEGRTTYWLADHLNALGIPPSYVKDGRPKRRGERTSQTAGIWTPGRIRNIVVSPTYKGVHLYGKRSDRKREVIERPVPPIVDQELWEATQATLRRNQLTSMRNAKRVYLLRGKLVCALCGQTLYGSFASRRGGEEFYYKCGGKIAYRGTKAGEDPRASCRGKSIPGIIEEWVWADIERLIHNPGELLARLTEADSSGLASREEILAALAANQEAMKAKEAEILRVARLHSKGVYTDAQAEAVITQIQSEEATLKAERGALSASLKEGSAEAARLADTQSLLERLRGAISEATRRQVVELLVDRIVVRTLNPEATAAQRRAELDIYYVFSPDRAFDCSYNPKKKRS